MNPLLFFKILGAVITAAGAMHKALKGTVKPTITADSEYPDNVVEDDRAKLVARIEWSLILGGLLITVVSASLEQQKSTKSSRAAQLQASNQLHQAQEQISKAKEILDRVEDQARQSKTILTNVERQGIAVQQALEALSTQSTQTRAIMTNVQQQAVLTGKSIDSMERLLTRFRTITVESMIEFQVASLTNVVRAFPNFVSDLHMMWTNQMLRTNLPNGVRIDPIGLGRQIRTPGGGPGPGIEIDLECFQNESLLKLLPNSKAVWPALQCLDEARIRVVINKQPVPLKELANMEMLVGEPPMMRAVSDISAPNLAKRSSARLYYVFGAI